MKIVTKNITLWLVGLVFCLVAAFPVYQIIQTGGLVFYTNAHDEGYYLQYDFSNHVVHLAARWGQYLVSFLHVVGVSGGWINFLFDLSIPILCIILLRSALKKVAVVSKNADEIIIISLTGALLFLNTKLWYMIYWNKIKIPLLQGL